MIDAPRLPAIQEIGDMLEKRHGWIEDVYGAPFGFVVRADTSKAADVMRDLVSAGIRTRFVAPTGGPYGDCLAGIECRVTTRAATEEAA